jgi:hypothetical protein
LASLISGYSAAAAAFSFKIGSRALIGSYAVVVLILLLY